MAYDFSELKKQIADTTEWLKREFTGIRTGRASPAVLDGVTVELYGTMLPINQAATITTEDARTLRIQPWDQSAVKSIEKAIADADLGLSISDDEKGIRVSFPELTVERREQLAKLARSKLEEARKALRTARDEVWSDIQKKQNEGEITEDEKYKYKEEMQKLIDEANTALEDLTKQKEQELNQ